MELEVEVSIGEALDKLTILDIKKARIQDAAKRADVVKEYTSLAARLTPYLSRVPYLYSILLQTNTYIWDLLDDVKTKQMSSTEKLRLYEVIWDENDRRYRIKSKINTALNSNLKEQKGYAQRKVFVLGHLGMGDMIYCNGMVRYLSTLYDRVTVVCKESSLANLREMYADDASIDFYPVKSDADISPAYGVPMDTFRRITSGYDVTLMGIHSPNYSYRDQIQKIPTTFYSDAKVPWHTFWTYFSVAPQPDPLPVPSVPYIFTHTTSSTGVVFSTETIESTLGCSKDTTLIVDPCLNHYPEGHPWYALAQTYVGARLFQYTDVMTSAQDLMLSDSSFMVYAWHLNLTANRCLIRSRGTFRTKDEYMHLWTPEYGAPTGLPRKAFKQVYE